MKHEFQESEIKVKKTPKKLILKKKKLIVKGKFKNKVNLIIPHF